MTHHIQNLGAALAVLAHAEVAEHFMHDDVAAFGAPSECHELVSRGEKERERLARRHAESIARAPLRVILAQAKKRGGIERGGPRWYHVLSKMHAAAGYPF